MCKKTVYSYTFFNLNKQAKVDLLLPHSISCDALYDAALKHSAEFANVNFRLQLETTKEFDKDCTWCRNHPMQNEVLHTDSETWQLCNGDWLEPMNIPPPPDDY